MQGGNAGWAEQTPVAEAILRLGKAASECAALIACVTESTKTYTPILDLKKRLRATGIECESDSFERVLLGYAARESEGKIDALPVPQSVRDLIRKQFHYLTQPPGLGGPALTVDGEENDPFIAASKVCTLRRFPAGPIDWVVSGLPRSWLLKMPPWDVPKVLKFVFQEFGGIKPAFYVHIAHPPRNRSLIIQKEVRKAYFRMAQALILQPEIKGIMCATWLHDPAAIEMYPHLAPLNEPYLNLGGKLITNLGSGRLESGFMKYNSERRDLYERGKVSFKSVLAMWPRKAAIEWAQQNTTLQ
jgi:hypothetical protein